MIDNKKMIGFDGDGVIFDSFEFHFRHMKEVCFSLSIDFENAMDSFLKRNDRRLSDFDQIIDAYKTLLNTPGHFSHFYEELGINYYENESLINDVFIDYMDPNYIIVFDGVAELINELRDKSIRVCLITSNYRKIVKEILERSGMDFDYIICSEDVNKHKPNPEGLEKCLEFFNLEPDEAVYIGDMVADALAADLAKIDFIGVTYGYTMHGILEQYPHVALVDSVESLKKTLLPSY